MTSSVPSNPKMIHGNIQWPEAASIKQNFSLTSSIMYYITKNPLTPKCYSKLIQSCKHFFEKNPILVVKTIYNNRICHNVFNTCEDNRFNCCLNFDISKCKSKIWISNELKIRNFCPNFNTVLVPKLFRLENKMLLYKTTINFDDFKILGSTATSVHLYDNVIMDKNGNNAMLETIFEALSNIQIFEYSFTNDTSMITASSIKKISQLKNIKNLQKMYLTDLPNILSVEDLSKFIKENEKIQFCFSFRNDISEAYKNQLDAMIDTVIESNVRNRLIRYLGVNIKKYRILSSRFYITIAK